MRIYISHSTGCAGWDMPSIYAGTTFANACRTTRYKPADRGIVKMLDWDYQAYQKNPEMVKTRHLEIARDDPGIEVVMSMDLWAHNTDEALAYTDELAKHADRVLVPAHYFPARLRDHTIALPNANWFAANTPCPARFRDNVTHLLGGSPHAQLRLAPLYPKLESVDGNQIFNVAVRAGKYWSKTPPHWRKSPGLTNEQLFHVSVRNVDAAWAGPVVPWPALDELAREDERP